MRRHSSATGRRRPRLKAAAPNANDANLAVPRRDACTIALVGGHRLEVATRSDRQNLLIRRPDGGEALRITIRPDRVSIELDASAVVLGVTGELAIRAGHLALHGEQGITMTTSEDLNIQAAGDLSMVARSQKLVSVLGDVAIEANDDVRLNGERVLVQC